MKNNTRLSYDNFEFVNNGSNNYEIDIDYICPKNVISYITPHSLCFSDNVENAQLISVDIIYSVYKKQKILNIDCNNLSKIYNDFGQQKDTKLKYYNLHFNDIYFDKLPLMKDIVEFKIKIKTSGKFEKLFFMYAIEEHYVENELENINYFKFFEHVVQKIDVRNFTFSNQLIHNNEQMDLSKHQTGLFIYSNDLNKIQSIEFLINNQTIFKYNQIQIEYDIVCLHITDKCIFITFGKIPSNIKEIIENQKNDMCFIGHINFDNIDKVKFRIEPNDIICNVITINSNNFII